MRLFLYVALLSVWLFLIVFVNRIYGDMVANNPIECNWAPRAGNICSPRAVTEEEKSIHALFVFQVFASAGIILVRWMRYFDAT